MTHGYAQVNGLETYYEVHGTGQPLVLLHGGDRRLAPALRLLKEKRRSDGTWLMDRVHPDLGAGAQYALHRKPRPFSLEEPGKPSKWITLNALRVLKRAGYAS